MSKSDSVISTLDTLIEDEESGEVFEETELSFTFPSDQTTVIDNQTTVIEVATSVKPENTETLLQQSTLNADPNNVEQNKTNHWLEDNSIFESREKRQARERALPVNEYLISRTWEEYLKETERHSSDELTKYGNYHYEYCLHYDDDKLPYYRGRRSKVYNEIREIQYIVPLTLENYLEWLNYRKTNPENEDLEIKANRDRLEEANRSRSKITVTTRQRSKSRSPIETEPTKHSKKTANKMTKDDDVIEINVLKNVDIKIEGGEQNLTDFGEIVKQLGVKAQTV